MALSNFAVWKYILDIRHGRIHRADYFISGLAIKVSLDAVNSIFPHPDRLTFYFVLIFYTLTLYLSALITARRLRDINLSGWWALPLLLVQFSWLFLFEFYDVKDAGRDVLIWSLLGMVVTVLIPNMLILLWRPHKKDNRYGAYIVSVFAVSSVKSIQDIWPAIKERAEKYGPSKTHKS